MLQYQQGIEKSKAKSQDDEKKMDPSTTVPTFTSRTDPSPQTDLFDFMKCIPYQQNGIVYSQESSSDKKRKADDAAMERMQSKVVSMPMSQERHWMEMWKDARAELSKLRKELKEETDEEVLLELKSDIEALKRKKDEWAMHLGMKV